MLKSIKLLIFPTQINTCSPDQVFPSKYYTKTPPASLLPIIVFLDRVLKMCIITSKHIKMVAIQQLLQIERLKHFRRSLHVKYFKTAVHVFLSFLSKKSIIFTCGTDVKTDFQKVFSCKCKFKTKCDRIVSVSAKKKLKALIDESIHFSDSTR